MAAGQPFLSTDIDRWIYGVLSVDPFMIQYAPGGFWAQDPDQISNGAWQAGTSYRVNDIVTFEGWPYRSLVDSNVGHEPDSSPTDWTSCFPCVRWWRVASGRDIHRQDGVAGRAESSPKVFICILDRQAGGFVDFMGGSNGHIEDGVLRINSLMHARRETITVAGGRSMEMTAYAEFADARKQQLGGNYDVMVGHQYQIRVQ